MGSSLTVPSASQHHHTKKTAKLNKIHKHPNPKEETDLDPLWSWICASDSTIRLRFSDDLRQFQLHRYKFPSSLVKLIPFLIFQFFFFCDIFDGFRFGYVDRLVLVFGFKSLVPFLIFLYLFWGRQRLDISGRSLILQLFLLGVNFVRRLLLDLCVCVFVVYIEGQRLAFYCFHLNLGFIYDYLFVCFI